MNNDISSQLDNFCWNIVQISLRYQPTYRVWHLRGIWNTHPGVYTMTEWHNDWCESSPLITILQSPFETILQTSRRFCYRKRLGLLLHQRVSASTLEQNRPTRYLTHRTVYHGMQKPVSIWVIPKGATNDYDIGNQRITKSLSTTVTQHQFAPCSKNFFKKTPLLSRVMTCTFTRKQIAIMRLHCQLKTAALNMAMYGICLILVFTTPRKPKKTRVVFNAAAMFQGKSLNHEFLSDPDSLNNLLGIPIRFRRTIWKHFKPSSSNLRIAKDCRQRKRRIWRRSKQVHSWRLLFGWRNNIVWQYTGHVT